MGGQGENYRRAYPRELALTRCVRDRLQSLGGGAAPHATAISLLQFAEKVARAPRERLHGDEVLGGDHGHAGVADEMLLHAGEELLLETRAGEHHIDGDPGFPVHEGQDLRRLAKPGRWP